MLMGLIDFFKKRDTLYFPGCITYFKFREYFELYQEIFRKLGINVVSLDEQRCSGIELWEAGYDFDFRKVARENLEIFRSEGVNRIIATEPGCYKILSKDYPRILPNWGLEVVNIWDLILEKLTKKSWLLKNSSEALIVSYHDSCYLGRYCNIYNSPRSILELLGYRIREMDNHMENSFCCGSCGGLARTNPDIAKKIARERLLQAKRVGVDKVVVVGFENYSLMKEVSEEVGIRVFELSEILADALGIKEINFEEVVEEELSDE